MIVSLCAKHKKNPSRTVNATERTRFSKWRPNDLEDIGQGQSSSHATHPLMLLIICTKYRKNPSWTVDATGQTRKVNGQTDGQTDRQTDRQGESNTPPPPHTHTHTLTHTHTNFVAGGIIRKSSQTSSTKYKSFRLKSCCEPTYCNIDYGITSICLCFA